MSAFTVSIGGKADSSRTSWNRRYYPQAAEFFRLKRHYDPDELLQNQFYRRYGLETSGDVGTQAN